MQSTGDVYKKEYTEFINLATHDLDAPLRKLSTLVSMLTNKLKPGLQDTDALRYIERIESSVADMRSLIDDMAMLSRIISEGEDAVQCDLDDVVQEIISGFSHMIKQKKAKITISDLPKIECIPDQIRQLFKSLIENALKFSKEGDVSEIHIKACRCTDEEKEQFHLPDDLYYKIEIVDSGIGFRPESAERIFRPFERLHGKSQFGGNGIGLAACKKIVDNHEGIIYAEGNENAGARFTLILPQTRSRHVER